LILDGFFQFTAAAGDSMPNAATTTSTNQIDLGVGLVGNPQIPAFSAGGGARDLGVGDQPSLKVLVEVTTAGAGTSIQVNLQGAPDNGSGAPGSFTTYITGPVVTAANAVAGSRLLEIDIPRPPAGVVLPRYLQLQYVGVGNMSAGVMKAWAVLDRFDQPGSQSGVLSGYPAGVTIPN
jgi:Bbp16-like protein